MCYQRRYAGNIQMFKRCGQRNPRFSNLLSFASRFQVYWVARYLSKDKKINLKQKNGALLISAGGDSKDLDERAFKTANHIFSLINTHSIGMACTMHTNDLPAKDDIEALSKVRELALKLNEFHSSSQSSI